MFKYPICTDHKRETYCGKQPLCIICLYMCVSECMYVCTYNMCMYTDDHIHVHVHCTYTCIYVHMHMHVDMHVCVCVRR